MGRQSCYLILSIALICTTYADLGFPIESTSVPEGATAFFVFTDFGENKFFTAGPPEVFCEAFLNMDVNPASLNVDFEWYLNGIKILSDKALFTLSPSDDVAEFEVVALNDAVDDDFERVHVGVHCHDSEELTPFNTVHMVNCDFELVILDSGVTDDPHFFQLVRGTDESGKTVRENICYDLIGAADDIYELLTDSILKSSVSCKLRDDYYMGQIRIETPTNVFLADTEYVSIKGKFRRSWNDIQKFEEGMNPLFSVESMENTVVVAYKEGGRKMAVRIEREVQAERGKNYLNLFIEETTESAGVIFDKNHGGLFGVAANNEYHFTRPVQENGNMAEVLINNRKVEAYYQTSSTAKAKCYLLNLEDVITPYSKIKFMRPF